MVLSSHPIPGNEFSVGRVIDDLHRRGAEVLHSAHEPVHVWGTPDRGASDAARADTPAPFVPVHGEYRHLVHHRASPSGWACRTTKCCCARTVTPSCSMARAPPGPKVPAGFVYVDGHTGDLDDTPIEDRRMLASDGVVLVAAGVDTENGKLVAWPTVSTRGWFDGEQESTLRTRCAEVVARALDDALAKGERGQDALNQVARRAAGRFLGSRRGARRSCSAPSSHLRPRGPARRARRSPGPCASRAWRRRGLRRGACPADRRSCV